MAHFLMVRHKVNNFATWKRGYAAHKPARTKAGLTEKSLLRSASDPNDVFILFHAKDAKKAKAFAESEDLKTTMMKVGVIEKPDIWFLKA